MQSNHPPPVNHKPPSQPLPGVSYSRDHLRPAGHMAPLYSGGPPQLFGPSYQWANDYHVHPIGVHEAIWRQMEKERIRKEIIAEEISKRRILEAEVRRELLIERDLAMQRGSDGSIYTSHLKSMILDPKGLPHLTSPQNMDGSFHGEMTGLSALVRHEYGSFETESQRVAEPRTLEFMAPSDTKKEKPKVILLAKPEEKVSAMKRKAEVLPAVSAKRKAEVSPSVGASELTSGGAALKKKLKEESSCALCQISTTSEQALKEHLQGKKHKAKEAGLRKNGKSIGLYPKTISESNELLKIPSSPSLGIGIPESMKPSIAIQEKANSKNLETNNNAVVFISHQLDKTLKKNKAPTCGAISTRKSREQNFKFWCEMCQVGAFSQKVMEAHRMGKKHVARLLGQKTVSKLSNQVMQAIPEMNLTGETGEVVEGTSTDSGLIIEETKLAGYQKEAGEDGEGIASKGLGAVANEVELEGNQNKAVVYDSGLIIEETKLARYQKEVGEDGEGIASKGLGGVADEVELEGNQNKAVVCRRHPI